MTKSGGDIQSYVVSTGVIGTTLLYHWVNSCESGGRVCGNALIHARLYNLFNGSGYEALQQPTGKAPNPSQRSRFNSKSEKHP